MKSTLSLLAPLLLLTLAGPVHAVDISVALTPSGPITVGETVTVEVSVNNWDPADPEVDGIDFNVDFNPTLFEYVAGSGAALDDGTEFLSKANQGPGYNLDDQSDDSLTAVGRFVMTVIDSGDLANGSLGSDGVVGSFRLLSIASGDATVEPIIGNPSLVFFDPGLFGIAPTGGIALQGQDIKITDPTTPVTYASWAADQPFASNDDARPDRDPDCDGIDNLTEYALNLNPLSPDAERLPCSEIFTVGQRDFVGLEYERPGGSITRTDLAYAAQVGTDLENWTEDIVVISESPPSVLTEMVTVRLRAGTAIGSTGGTRQFIRLRFRMLPVVFP